MKKTLLRFLAFMLVLITALSFIACDGDTPPGHGHGQDPGKDPTNDTGQTKALTKKKSALRINYFDDAELIRMQSEKYEGQ